MSLTTTSPFWFSSGATSAGGGTVVYPYSIGNSVRLEDGGLEIVDASNTGNNKTFTISMWFKRSELGVVQYLVGAGTGSDATFFFGIDSDNSFWYRSRYANTNGAAFEWSRKTITSGPLIRDVSAWYHLVIVTDTTRTGATSQLDYFDIYLNGVNITAQFSYVRNTERSVASIYNEPTRWNTASSRPQTVGFYGAQGTDTGWFNGYIAEVHSVDGQALTASDFGQYSNGVWVPKEVSIADYGTRGFYFDFADSSNLGNDASSGGTEDYTANNVAASDQSLDSPTNNWTTLNSVGKVYGAANVPAFSEGNLKSVTGTYPTANISTFAIEPNDTTGYYWEVKIDLVDSARSYIGIIAPENTDLSGNGTSYGWPYKYILSATGDFFGSTATNGTGTVAQTSYTTGDILMFAYKEGKIWIGKNGTWMNSGDPAAGTGNLLGSDGSTPSDRGDVTWYPYAGYNLDVTANFGQEGTFAGSETAGGNSDANGYGDFKYSVPSGFLAMCSANLPAPAIGPNQASGQQADDYFEPILYTGNGAVQHIGSGGAQHPVDVTTIANSIRFNDNDNPKLSLDPVDTPTLGTKCTISFWFKRGSSFGSTQYLFTGEQSNLYYDHLYLTGAGGDKLAIVGQENASSYGYQTSAIFRDSSKWYHVVLECDSTQATGTDRYKLYVDGTQETLTSIYGVHPQNHVWYWNKSGDSQNVGRSESYGNSFDGYLAEFYFIDGTALDPTYFGQYGSNGYWIPKAVSGLTYGTNGFYLDYSDNSTANALGTDSSGNANNFSATNIATTDQMGDSPTQNFATFDPNRPSGTTLTLSEGNLKAERTSTSFAQAYSTFSVTSGKWYAEFIVDTGNSGLGVIAGETIPGTNRYMGQDSYTYGYYFDGRKVNNATYTSYGDSYTTAADGSGDVVGVLIDADNGNISFSKNGVIQNSGVPAFTGVKGPFRFAIASESNCFLVANFGQDDSFAGFKTPSSGAQAADGNGYGSFYYTPPTGYLALVDDNIPLTGIESPDIVLIKSRDNSQHSNIFDTIRGPNKILYLSTALAETDSTNHLSSFDKQGFTVQGAASVNASVKTYVAWTWKASGADSTFNIDGTGYSTAADAGLTGGDITPTGASINTTAGLSIIRYTGNGTLNQTLKHGLSKAPEMIWNKDRDANSNNNGWWVTHTPRGDDYAQFHTTNGWTGTALVYPTSGDDTTVTVGRTSPVANSNESGDDYIQYHWHSVDGFSKVGLYTGNGSTDGAFVYTGFRPAWIMIKSTAGSTDWCFYDNVRTGYNVDNNLLRACTTGNEQTDDDIDLLSNGFKLRRNSPNFNSGGVVYTYFAMAENPFKYANAR